MSSSEVYSDETFSSNESEPDYVDEYELEVEQFDVAVQAPLRHRTRQGGRHRRIGEDIAEWFRS